MFKITDELLFQNVEYVNVEYVFRGKTELFAGTTLM